MKENRIIIHWRSYSSLSKEARLLWADAPKENSELDKKINQQESTLESLKKLKDVTSMVDSILQKFSQVTETTRRKWETNVTKAKADLEALAQKDVSKEDIENAMNTAKVTALTAALNAQLITDEEMSRMLSSTTQTVEVGRSRKPDVSAGVESYDNYSIDVPEDPDQKLEMLQNIKDAQKDLRFEIAQAKGSRYVERDPKYRELQKKYWKVRRAWEKQTGQSYSMLMRIEQEEKMDRLYELNGTTREEVEMNNRVRNAARESSYRESGRIMRKFNRNRAEYMVNDHFNSMAARGRQIMADATGRDPESFKGSGLTGTDVAYQSHLLRAAARGDTVAHVPGGAVMIVPKGFRATRFNSNTGGYDSYDPMPLYRKYLFGQNDRYAGGPTYGAEGGGNSPFRRPLSGYRLDDKYRDAYTGRRRNGGAYDGQVNSYIDKMGGEGFMREQEQIGNYWNEVNADKLANDFNDLKDDPEFQRLMKMKERRERFYGSGTDNLRYYVDQFEKLRRIRQNENVMKDIRITPENKDRTIKQYDILADDVYNNSREADQLHMVGANIEVKDDTVPGGWRFITQVEDPRKWRIGGLSFFGRGSITKLRESGISPEVLRFDKEDSQTPTGNIRGLRLNFTKPGTYRIRQPKGEPQIIEVKDKYEEDAPPINEKPKPQPDSPGDLKKEVDKLNDGPVA